MKNNHYHIYNIHQKRGKILIKVIVGKKKLKSTRRKCEQKVGMETCVAENIIFDPPLLVEFGEQVIPQKLQ